MIDEAEITQEITKEFLNDLAAYSNSDVVVVGAGPAGLVCSYYLAKQGFKVVLLERNVHAGGGLWQGGLAFPKFLIEEPADKIAREFGIKLKPLNSYLYIGDSLEGVSKLLSAASDVGVKLFNNMIAEDIIVKENRIAGIVINWFFTSLLPKNLTCFDPLSIKSRIVIDATGHEASVAAIAAKKLNGIEIKGHSWMDAENAEKAVVEYTKEIYPGLIVAGMAVASVFGLPRMGPIYGGMFLSGKKAAEIALERLRPATKAVELGKMIEASISK